MVVELILAMVLSADPAASPTEPASLPRAIPTRQMAFSIPFRIQRVQHPSQEPVEVQLYVSTDRGVSWRMHNRVDPQQGHFLFRAGGDGEYWFLMRTLDRTGQVRPQGEARPGLRVMVDTTPPKLRLEAQAAEDGRLVARWLVDDPFPSLDSLKLQYRTSPMQTWQSVAIDHPGQAEGTVYTGEVSWLSQALTGRVEIRAEVADTAGNPAVSHAQVDLPGDRMAATHGAATFAAHPGSPANLAPGRDVQSAPPTWQVPQATGLLPGPPAQWSTTPPQNALQNGPIAGSPVNVNPRREAGPVSIQINPPVRRQYGPATQAASPPISPAFPRGVHPRMVNTRVFELDYNVDAVGPSGIAKVELWGTRDGGRTWSSFGEDADQRTPMVVTVDEDGICGFRVCVQNGVGLGGGPPPSGQSPDVWIGVDQAKPELRIVSAEQGRGEQAGRLLIRWESRDWVLTARPVSLFYSVTMGGPWTPIVAGLEAAGQYNWLVEGRLPERIFLRAEARDEAGNLGIFETQQPVMLDKLHPSVHIQQVRPVGR